MMAMRKHAGSSSHLTNEEYWFLFQIAADRCGNLYRCVQCQRFLWQQAGTMILQVLKVEGEIVLPHACRLAEREGE